MALRRKNQSLTRFLTWFKKPISRLFMSIALSWTVSFSAILENFFYAYSTIVDSFVIVYFFLEIHYVPQHYRWLTCYVCASLCQCFGQGGCYFRCDKSCTCNYTCTQSVAVLIGSGWAMTPQIFGWPLLGSPSFLLKFTFTFVWLTSAADNFQPAKF